MNERIFFIIWACWLVLILIAAFRVFAFPFARRLQDKKWAGSKGSQRPVAVIVAVKGFDLQSSPRFFDTLFSQDYASYRVIVTFESWSDPVAVWLKNELEVDEHTPQWTHPDPDHSLKNITLVCAGLSEREGQKVHNQRAAFQYLTDEDRIVAFVDADIVFKRSWLTDLTAPINLKTHPLSTTYRWLVPKRPNLPNQVASVINASITTQGGWESTNILWGGSMAIARSVFDKLNVPQLLEGSLNDDLRLSKAARANGNRIAFVRSLIVPTLIDFNWRSFFEFARRQYTQVKFFSPIVYTGANSILTLYALGLISVIAGLVLGYFSAWIPLAAAYVIDQFRSLARQQIYLSLFPENGIRRKIFSASWLEHMMTPFWMLLHWFLISTTWLQNKITWAGITYRILGKDKTRILSRPSSEGTLPVSAPGLALIAGLHDRPQMASAQAERPLFTGTVTPSPTEAIAVRAAASTPEETITTAGEAETKDETLTVSPATEPITPPATSTAAPVEEPPPGEEALALSATAAAIPLLADEISSEPQEDPPSSSLPELAPPAEETDEQDLEASKDADPQPAAPPIPSPPLRHPGVSAVVTPLTALATLPDRSKSPEKKIPHFLIDAPANQRHPSPQKGDRAPIHLLPKKHFPTHPELAQSTPPTGTGLPIEPPTPPSAESAQSEVAILPTDSTDSTDSTALAASFSYPSDSLAAHRNTFPRSRRVGCAPRRTACSSRPSPPGQHRVTGRGFRRICQSAAGRMR